MSADPGAVAKHASRSAVLFLGGACELSCAVCDCRDTADPRGVAALDGGGGRVVLRGSPSGAKARFAEAIRAARERGFVDVVVRTNALAYMEPAAAAELATLGANAALVPLFSSASAAHDRIAGRPDALAHALVGMRALAQAGLAIEIEIPLLSSRLQDPAALVTLANRAVPSLRALRFFVPRGPLPRALAPPRWDEAGEGGAAGGGLAEGVRRARELGVRVALRGADGVPLCALRGAPELHDAYRFDPRATLRLAGGASYGEACASCAARAQCPGRTASYRDAHGDGGLVAFARKPKEMYAQRTGGPVFTAAHRRMGAQATMVVLRPTVNCNQDCPFCSANETSNNVWTDSRSMLQAISRAARRGVSRVSFSGGEPTLSRDLVHYVNAAHRLGVGKIELVTNGVLLDDPRRVKALRDAGLTEAFVSLHAHDERLSSAMTQKIGDHARSVKAIHNLIAAGLTVSVNHVVNARNYPFLERYVEFVRAEFGGATPISLALVTPQYRALEAMSLVPKLSDVAPFVRRALHLAIDLGQPVVVGSRQGMPPCALREFAGWSDVLRSAAEAAAEDAPQKQRAPGCERCRYTRQCTGLFRSYVSVHGLDELTPVEGPAFTDEELLSIAGHPRGPAPLAFDEVHPLLRDRDAEQAGRRAYEAEAAAPPKVRALPVLSALATQRSRPVRVALVGSGRQARRLARAARQVPGLSIDAVASPHAPDADLREFGGCPSFRALEEALDEMRPEAVIVAAATHAHRALAEQALARGVPVLLEKPLARTEDEAEELVRLAGAKGAPPLLVAHNMIFTAGLQPALDAAELPSIAYTHRCTRASSDSVRAWSRSALYEVLYHALSVVLAAVAGAPRVTLAQWTGDAAPERVRVLLAYPAAEAEVVLDFAASAEETVLVRRASASAPPAVTFRRAGPVTTLTVGDREVPVVRDGSDVERMLAHFRDVVLGKVAPMVTAAQALEVMRATRAAIEALDAAGAPFDRPNAPRHVASPQPGGRSPAG